MSLQLFADARLEIIAAGCNKLLAQTACGVLSFFTYTLIYLFLLEDGFVGFLTIPCMLFLLSCLHPRLLNGRKNKQHCGWNEMIQQHKHKHAKVSRLVQKERFLCQTFFMSCESLVALVRIYLFPAVLKPLIKPWKTQSPWLVHWPARPQKPFW